MTFKAPDGNEQGEESQSKKLNTTSIPVTEQIVSRSFCFVFILTFIHLFISAYHLPGVSVPGSVSWMKLLCQITEKSLIQNRSELTEQHIFR